MAAKLDGPHQVLVLVASVEPCLELMSIYKLNASVQGSTEWGVPVFAYKQALVLVVGRQVGCDNLEDLYWEIHGGGG